MSVKVQRTVNAAEWIAIGNWAIHTRSLVTAAKIAARIRKLGGKGTIDGVEWMGLSLFEQLVAEAAQRQTRRKSVTGARRSSKRGE